MSASDMDDNEPPENVAAAAPGPPRLWRRTSRRLISVEVIDRDYLFHGPPLAPVPDDDDDDDDLDPMDEAMVIDLCTPEREGTTAEDSDGPLPPKRVCTEPDQSQKEDEPYKCPVCLDSVSQREPVSTRCGHVFCQGCLMAAIGKAPRCPLCNAKLKQHHIKRIYL